MGLHVYSIHNTDVPFKHSRQVIITIPRAILLEVSLEFSPGLALICITNLYRDWGPRSVYVRPLGHHLLSSEDSVLLTIPSPFTLTEFTMFVGWRILTVRWALHTPSLYISTAGTRISPGPCLFSPAIYIVNWPPGTLKTREFLGEPAEIMIGRYFLSLGPERLNFNSNRKLDCFPLSGVLVAFSLSHCSEILKYQ